MSTGMVETLGLVVRGMICGVQDSVVGLLSIYSICKEADALEEQSLKSRHSPPRSVLATRRAERLKTNASSAKKQRLGFDATSILFHDLLKTFFSRIYNFCVLILFYMCSKSSVLSFGSFTMMNFEMFALYFLIDYNY